MYSWKIERKGTVSKQWLARGHQPVRTHALRLVIEASPGCGDCLEPRSRCVGSRAFATQCTALLWQPGSNGGNQEGAGGKCGGGVTPVV